MVCRIRFARPDRRPGKTGGAAARGAPRLVRVAPGNASGYISNQPFRRSSVGLFGSRRSPRPRAGPHGEAPQTHPLFHPGHAAQSQAQHAGPHHVFADSDVRSLSFAPAALAAKIAACAESANSLSADSSPAPDPVCGVLGIHLPLHAADSFSGVLRNAVSAHGVAHGAFHVGSLLRGTRR